VIPAAVHVAAASVRRALDELNPDTQHGGPGRRRSPLVKLLPLVVVVPMVFVVGLVAGAPSADPSCGAQPDAMFDGDLARVLATIRTVETGGDYTTTIASSSASGAYAFIDAAWGNYGGYSRAWLAPPGEQDAKAAESATAILQRSHGDVSAVPVTWYIGHLPAAGSPEWDTVPAPSGNTLTPRQYQAKWMAIYNAPADSAPPDWMARTGSGVTEPTCTGVVTGLSPAPAGVDQLVASQISWGGYANGQIPYEAMRYSPHSGYLHPAASAAWDQLYAAALADGFDLTGSGYRPASAGGHTAGNSNHGWGLAIDVAVLVTGNRYPTDDTAFASPEYRWLQTHAATYGFVNPAFARPVSLGGTGRGGWRGDRCCFFEAWYWEWTAFLTLPAATAAGAES
jgi:hypothetical protein